MKRKKSQVSNGAKAGKVCCSEVSEVLKRCGFKLGKSRHTITNDPCTFVKSLGLDLLSTSRRDTFFVGLQDYIEDTDNLKVAMLPAEVENRESHLTRDSLIRLLLLVPNLGEPLLELLLERLPLMSDDSENCNLPALVVQQLRWLPSTPANLINKLNEVLPACPIEVQREVIPALPEMVGDPDHVEICTLLLDLFSTIELVPTILEALSNLTLNEKLTEEVCHTVEEQLSALSADAIPAALKFLLLTQPDPLTAVHSIRDNIDFKSLAGEENKESEVLALQTLEQALRFHNDIQKTWIKVLTKPGSVEHFDILVMLLLLRVANKPKTVLALIRSHVRSGLVTWLSLDELFNAHTSTVLLYNTESLSLAHFLFMCSECKVGATLYTNLFTLGDVHTKQEVVGALISHIGSGDEKEVDAGISTLNTLQENCAKALERFSPLLQGLLDHLTQLTLPQARQVLTMLVHTSDCRGSGGVADDLHIITRKYMAHSSKKLQKLGVVGTTALIQGLAEPSEVTVTQAVGSQPTCTLSSREFGQVKSLLDKIKSSTSTKPALFSLFCDELSVGLAKTPTDLKVVKLIMDDFMSIFQDSFITPTAVGSTQSEYMDVLNLDLDVNSQDEESYLAVNIWQYVSKGEMQQLQQLCPLFRLVATCVNILEKGDLEDLNAVLGCPIRFSPLNDISKHGEKGVHGLFSLINWTIEIINTFAEEGDPTMKGKVVQRVHSLHMLQGELRSALLAHPGLVPLPASFDVDIAPITGEKKRAKPRAEQADISLSPSAADKTLAGTMAPTLAPTLAPTAAPSAAAPATTADSKPGVPLAKYAPYIRELELKVFTVITHGEVKKSVLDSEENTVENETFSLDNDHVCMLLSDLYTKCKYRLKPASKIGPPVSSAGYSRLLQHTEAELVHCVLGVLPCLCERMEGVVNKNNESFDGIVDAVPDIHTAQLFELVFNILRLVLSWPSFNQHADITTQLFDNLSSRLNNNTQGPLSSRKKLAGNYLLSYSDSLTTLGATLALLQCAAVLQGSLGSEALSERVAKICRGTLEREWSITQAERERKLRVNEGVGTLCTMYVQYKAEGVSTALEELIGCLGEVAGGAKSSETLPMINKQSFPAVYKALLTELLLYQKSKDEGPMLTLGASIQYFSQLVTFIKTVETRPVLGSLIKQGQKFLDAFLSQGIATMESMFKSHYPEIQKMLKSLQQSTRMLHHLSSHTKVVKDVALTARVPMLKKSLEAFVLKVKAMLAANGCKEAFWIGNLKNRNLKGEEIVTQVEEESDDSLSELSVSEDEDGPDSDSLSVDY